MLLTLETEVKANAMSDDCLIGSFKDAVSEISSKLMVNKLATDLELLTGTFMKNHKSEMSWKLYFGFIKDYNTYFSKVDDQKCASAFYRRSKYVKIIDSLQKVHATITVR